MEFGFEDDQSHKPKKRAKPRTALPADEVPPFTEDEPPPFDEVPPFAPVDENYPGFEFPSFPAPTWADPNAPHPDLPFLPPEECRCRTAEVTADDIRWSF